MIVKRTFFKVEPRAALRATQNMMWLTQITDEAAADLDAKWELKTTSIGDVWVCMRRDKHGEMKEFARKSPPSYQRQRRYLIRQLESVNAIREKAKEMGFVMPEDDFGIVFYIAAPPSWTKKKKNSMHLKRHKGRMDVDNLQKMFFDAIFNSRKRSDRFNDKNISSLVSKKVWVKEPEMSGIEIIEFECGAIDRYFGL